MDSSTQWIEPRIKKNHWECEHCRTIEYKGKIHTDVTVTIILHKSGRNVIKPILGVPRFSA